MEREFGETRVTYSQENLSQGRSATCIHTGFQILFKCFVPTVKTNILFVLRKLVGHWIALIADF